MNLILQPWHLFLLILAGWINREQQQVIDYLRTENQVLRERLGKKRILLNDDQRRRLAVKGKVLGRRLLEEVGTLFTPETILRWHRMLVAQKWDYSGKRQSAGRPAIDEEIAKLTIKLAGENSTWGYDRIQGALANLSHAVSPSTVANVLKQHGLDLNAIAERFVRSVKSECVDRMIFFGENMLRRVLASYLDHYHHERNHQGLGNRLIEPDSHVGEAAGPIERRERLGGMLRYYYRQAA